MPVDQPSARGTWFDPAAQAAPSVQTGDRGYSPGPPLTPIDAGPLGKYLGPLLALVLLAVVVGAFVFVILNVFDDDGGNRDPGSNLAAGSVTAAAQVAPTEEEEDQTEPTQETSSNPEATQTPAGEESGAPTEEEVPEPTRTPKPKPTEPPAAISLLPTTGDLPDGFERTENDRRTEEAVASSFADPAEAAVKLEEWGWEENAYRTFEIPADSGPDPSLTTYVNISIHYFGAKNGARHALSYFADSVIQLQGLEEIEVEKIGQETRALKGSPDGVNLVVFYVRYGNYLIRIGGSSPQGDPTEDVLELAKKIVEG
jgi:hypothetical protein